MGDSSFLVQMVDGYMTLLLHVQMVDGYEFYIVSPMILRLIVRTVQCILHCSYGECYSVHCSDGIRHTTK